MKINRAYFAQKLKVACKTWVTLRPGEKLRNKHAGSKQFFFHAYRSVDRSAKYKTSISGTEVGDGWMFRAFLGFEDLGPAALETTVSDLDRSGLALFDVAVRSAADKLDGKTDARPPDILPFDAPDEEIVRRLATYSRDIDRLCETFGGYDVEAFRALAKWCMRHRASLGYNTVGGIGVVCAALEYGDRALAIELLQEVEEEWEANLRREPDRPLVQELYARFKGIHARLRGLMDLPVPD